MLSMCKDEHGKITLNVTDCDKLSEVKVVMMKNLGLLDFDQHMFSQMINVEELDISGNSLDNIPESIKLPKLKKLNCARNKFSDVMFVQQFPCLQEVNLTENDITFPDFCIASVLCPTLKRINNQEVNFKDLNIKIEDRLKPLINQVWAKHFAPIYTDSQSDAEFDAMSEKFRIMLKHANVQTTKLVTKFKDFKLLQLIDQFLEDLKSKPGQGRGLAKQYQRSLPTINNLKKMKTTDVKESSVEENEIPVMVIVNNDDGTSEAVEATLVVLNDEAVTSQDKPELIKFQTDIIFEDETVVDEDGSANGVSNDEQNSSSNTTTTTSEKKIKYWLYDGKAPPKKKDPVKRTPSRRPRGWLQQFVVGSATNNNNKKENCNERDKDVEQCVESNGTSEIKSSESNLMTCAAGSSVSNRTRVKSCVSSGGPSKKRVRFIDDDNNQNDIVL